nr:MAG TPA: hypothetical protein [Caudoviricetes sp.]
MTWMLIPPKVALGKSELELYMPLCCLLGFI